MAMLLLVQSIVIGVRTVNDGCVGYPLARNKAPLCGHVLVRASNWGWFHHDHAVTTGVISSAMGLLWCAVRSAHKQALLTHAGAASSINCGLCALYTCVHHHVA
jgi:hypothetical protein